ncbi:MAG TPA: GH25 family lysozyme [Candidatus Sericytochromatia bacterium]|jgi:lysozyme
MYGIDVYEGIGRVDWAAVKRSGKTFAFIRATEGVTIKDTMFAQHWPILKMDGLIRGAYHLFHPQTSSPTKQAQEYLKTIGKLLPGDFPPVLDVEVTDGASATTIIKGMKEWLAVVEKALLAQTGKKIKPIIYTFPNFWIETLNNPSGFAEYPLWIANFGVITPTVPSSFGKENWIIHQYEDNVENVPGVPTVADLNKFNLIQSGATGFRVNDIQQRLKNLKKPEFDPGVVDGIFSTRTKAAVIAFQKSRKLQADGVVGPKTWVSLLWA